MLNTSVTVSPESSAMGQKRPQADALQTGPRKRPTTQDPLVHHGRHFGRVVHAFCSVQTLLTNSLIMMGELADRDLETFSEHERKEFAVFLELLKSVPSLEGRIISADEEEVVAIAELIQKGANGARADDTKGMKCAIIDWITPNGQTLNPNIPRNAKAGRGFHHERTGALLCPAGYHWSNTEVKEKLRSGRLRVAGDQWPILLYANETYNAEDPWNGLLRSGILVSAFKHIFTSPSSVDVEESRATHSCNARIHGMRAVTKASIAYVVTQARFALTSAQVFSRTDLLTDSERFYNSILELLDDPEEKEEVELLLQWWNRQIFPANNETSQLPSENSALATIRRRRALLKAAANGSGAGALAANSAVQDADA